MPDGRVRWFSFPKGSRENAERYARSLQEHIGGEVTVGDYLAGIGGWELWVAPPREVS